MSSLIFESEVHRRPPERVRRKSDVSCRRLGEDAGLPMLVPIKNITLIPVLPAVSGC